MGLTVGLLTATRSEEKSEKAKADTRFGPLLALRTHTHRHTDPSVCDPSSL